MVQVRSTSLCIDLINLLRMQGHLESMRAKSGKRIETWDRPGRYIQVGEQNNLPKMERRAVRRQAAV